MRLSSVFAASFVAPLAAAHGMEGMPRIFGMPKQLRASHPLAGLQARYAAEPIRHFGPRQEEGRCGPSNGNKKCAQNECCSAAVSIDFRHVSPYIDAKNRGTVAPPGTTAKLQTACSILVRLATPIRSRLERALATMLVPSLETFPMVAKVSTSAMTLAKLQSRTMTALISTPRAL